ncbi:hypothetical protein ACOMHN_017140 [Nucella lapillus]
MGEGDRRRGGLLGPGLGLGSCVCSVFMVPGLSADISVFMLPSLPRAPTRAAAARLPDTVVALVMALLSNHKLQLSHLRADQRPEPEPEVAEQEAKKVSTRAAAARLPDPGPGSPSLEPQIAVVTSSC